MSTFTFYPNRNFFAKNSNGQFIYPYVADYYNEDGTVTKSLYLFIPITSNSEPSPPIELSTYNYETNNIDPNYLYDSIIANPTSASSISNFTVTMKKNNIKSSNLIIYSIGSGGGGGAGAINIQSGYTSAIGGSGGGGGNGGQFTSNTIQFTSQYISIYGIVFEGGQGGEAITSTPSNSVNGNNGYSAGFSYSNPPPNENEDMPSYNQTVIVDNESNKIINNFYVLNGAYGYGGSVNGLSSGSINQQNSILGVSNNQETPLYPVLGGSSNSGTNYSESPQSTKTTYYNGFYASNSLATSYSFYINASENYNFSTDNLINIYCCCSGAGGNSSCGFLNKSSSGYQNTNTSNNPLITPCYADFDFYNAYGGFTTGGAQSTGTSYTNIDGTQYPILAQSNVGDVYASFLGYSGRAGFLNAAGDQALPIYYPGGTISINPTNSSVIPNIMIESCGCGGGGGPGQFISTSGFFVNNINGSGGNGTPGTFVYIVPYNDFV